MIMVFLKKEIVLLEKEIDKLVDKSAFMQSSPERMNFFFLYLFYPKQIILFELCLI